MAGFRAGGRLSDASFLQAVIFAGPVCGPKRLVFIHSPHPVREPVSGVVEKARFAARFPADSLAGRVSFGRRPGGARRLWLGGSWRGCAGGSRRPRVAGLFVFFALGWCSVTVCRRGTFAC